MNRAIEELVRSMGDEQAWRSVCARADVDVDFFEGLESYPDVVTHDLVEAAAAEFSTTVPELLERFGRYWIVYTAAEGWGSLLDTLGTTVADVLEHLNDLHHRLRTTMPDLRPPEFAIVHRGPDRLDVDYRSDRPGLAPMVTGMLRGLAEMFDEDWIVTHVGPGTGEAVERFVLTSRVPAQLQV